MLLNIVDYDPRAMRNKRVATTDNNKTSNASSVHPVTVVTPVSESLKANQKQKLPQVAEPPTTDKVTLKRSNLGASLSQKHEKPLKRKADIPIDVKKPVNIKKIAAIRRDKSAASGDSSAAASGDSSAAASGDSSAAASVTQSVHGGRHRKPASQVDSDAGPDWSKVSACLLEEVRDVGKLFHEQLDIDTPTVYTEKVFSKLAIKDCQLIHPFLVSLLTEKLGLDYFTRVQADTLPLALAGRDVLIKTQTGSGKSLALLLPLVQQLQAVQPPLTRSSGVQALVICPTHELAEQTFQLLQHLLRPFVRIVAGLLVGGIKRKSQKASLRRGLNILVATPRRLLDHLEHSCRLDLGASLRMLVVDEADRLTEMGYEKDVRKIVEAACAGGRRPQTLLCSATLSDGAERLAGLALSQPGTVFEDEALPASVRHHVLAVPTRARLKTLLSVVRPLVAAGHKAAVFLPTQASVDFHHALLSALLSDSVSLCRLHGNLGHAERIRAFREFASKGGSGLLITTDVSARGLDLSHLAWVIQGPGEAQAYCHRAGRTARLGRPGRSLLLLDTADVASYLPLLTASECGRSLRFAPVPLDRLLAAFCPENFQQLSAMVCGDSQLKALAEAAFISTVRARATFAGELRTALPQPHLGHLAGSFCLSDPPGVIAANCRARKQKQEKPGDGDRRDVQGGGDSWGGVGDDDNDGKRRRTSKVTGGQRVVRAAGGRGGSRTDRMSEFASGI